MTFCILSAFFWSVLDLLRKQLVHSLGALQLAVVLALGQATLFALWIVLSAEPLELPARDYYAPACAALVLGGTGFYLYLLSLSVGAISLTVPLLSFTPAIAAVAALSLGERLAGVQWLGIGLVVCGGTALRGVSSGGSADTAANARAQLLMLGAACCWGVNTVFDKLALSHFSSNTAGAQFHGVVMTLLATLLYVAVLCRGNRRSGRRIWAGLSPLGKGANRVLSRASLGVLAAIGVAQIALATQLLAIQQIHVGVFETTKRGIGVLAAIVVGRMLFYEPVTKAKLIASGLMIVGLALICECL